jgi:hypothetical protein
MHPLPAILSNTDGNIQQRAITLLPSKQNATLLKGLPDGGKPVGLTVGMASWRLGVRDGPLVER